LTPGVEYYIQVDGWSGVPGRASIKVRDFCELVVEPCTTPPVNDDATAATEITVDGQAVGFDLTCATVEAGEPAGSGWFDGPFVDNSVWYRFTAPASGCAAIETVGPTGSVDTQLALYQASDPSDFSTFDELASDDDNGSSFLFASLIVYGQPYFILLTPGEEYYVQVDGWSGDQGTASIEVRDECPGLPTPIIKPATHSDTSDPLRDLATAAAGGTAFAKPFYYEVPKFEGPLPALGGKTSTTPGVASALDGALDEGPTVSTIPHTKVNFEGIANDDFSPNFVPPDTVGDVGPNHYVEMVNTAIAIYNRTGTPLLDPVLLGTVWQNFPLSDCAGDNGDPIVLYDQFVDRWILTQFTLGCFVPGGGLCYNCVAVSTSPDPTDSYYRYAFVAQADPTFPGSTYFPDYPKYGVWSDTYVLTTRDFSLSAAPFGVSTYALEKDKMVAGHPAPLSVQFFLDGSVPSNLIGNGLLPSDIDGKRHPTAGSPIPHIAMDFNALNMWDLSVDWTSPSSSRMVHAGELRTAKFDISYPCDFTPGGRPDACIPQPNTEQKVDFLGFFLLHRFAYRKFRGYESMVVTKNVQARTGVAGARWYEIRRYPYGDYSIYQQGTFSPDDGVNRWMGSIAQDAAGNMLLGYSVSSKEVYPGIRYTGRLADDPLGKMSLGEGTIIDGSGSQTADAARWGDYSSMNIDPVDDCTFWYTNQYYEITSSRGWQTRIASVELPGCKGSKGSKGGKSSKGSKGSKDAKGSKGGLRH